MSTMERELLAFATEAKREKPLRVAVLADLARISHIQDPTFFGVMRKRLEHASEGMSAMSFELPDYQICYILSPADAEELRHALARISQLLIDHGKTPIETRSFDLRRRAGQFLEFCRALALKSQEGESIDHAALSDEDANLDRFLTIEDNLHSADVSSLIREQPIYDFTNPEEPTVVAHELSVSLDDLEEIYNLSIRKNAWLLSRVTEILDGRILHHLMRDSRIGQRSFSINLHQSSVLGAQFHDFANRTSFGWQNNLIVEVPFIEATGSPDEFEATLEALRIHRALAAIDDVPLLQLERIPADKGIVRFVKVRWTDDIKELDEGVAETVRAEIARIGGERCVLTHCDDAGAVRIGLHLGFLILQGHGVDLDVTELRHQQTDRAIASRDIQASIFDDPDEEEPEGPLDKLMHTVFGKKPNPDTDEN